MKLKLILIMLCACILISACESYDPVSASKCGKIVSHGKKILGKMAPSRSDMMKECKAATDSERGCALAATTAGKLMACF